MLALFASLVAAGASKAASKNGGGIVSAIGSIFGGSTIKRANTQVAIDIRKDVLSNFDRDVQRLIRQQFRKQGRTGFRKAVQKVTGISQATFRQLAGRVQRERFSTDPFEGPGRQANIRRQDIAGVDLEFDPLPGAGDIRPARERKAAAAFPALGREPIFFPQPTGPVRSGFPDFSAPTVRPPVARPRRLPVFPASFSPSPTVRPPLGRPRGLPVLPANFSPLRTELIGGPPVAPLFDPGSFGQGITDFLVGPFDPFGFTSAQDEVDLLGPGLPAGDGFFRRGVTTFEDGSTATRVTPTAQLQAVNPKTGKLETWLHAGKPIAWSKVSIKKRRCRPRCR